MLNNRELASAIIVGALVAFGMFHRGFWTALGNLAKAAVTPKLLFLWLFYTACVGAAEYGLATHGLHYEDSVKDAVVWALIAGLPIYVKFDKASKDPTLLGRLLFDSVKLTALVEFFTNFYVFPLWVELPVQIALIGLGVLSAAATVTPDTPKEVRGCLTGLGALGGLAIIVVVAVHIATHWSAINWHEKGLSFLQPLALTVPAVAATAVITVIAAYELALFVNLTYPLNMAPAPTLRHRAALVLGLRLDVRKVAGFGGAVSVRLRETTSLGEALGVVRAYRRGEIGPIDWPGMPDPDDDEEPVDVP